MTPGVDGASAGGEDVLLDRPDQRAANPGTSGHLVDAQPLGLTGSGELRAERAPNRLPARLAPGDHHQQPADNRCRRPPSLGPGASRCRQTPTRCSQEPCPRDAGDGRTPGSGPAVRAGQAPTPSARPPCCTTSGGRAEQAQVEQLVVAVVAVGDERRSPPGDLEAHRLVQRHRAVVVAADVEDEVLDAGRLHVVDQRLRRALDRRPGRGPAGCGITLRTVGVAGQGAAAPKHPKAEAEPPARRG